MRHVHHSRPPTQPAPGQSPSNYSLVFDWVERACSLATIGWITLHKRPSSLSPPQLHAPVHTHTHLTNMRVVGIGVKSGHAPYNLSVMPSCWCTGIGLSHIILHLIAYHVILHLIAYHVTGLSHMTLHLVASHCITLHLIASHCISSAT